MIASPSSTETTSTNNETAVASEPRAGLLINPLVLISAGDLKDDTGLTAILQRIAGVAA